MKEYFVYIMTNQSRTVLYTGMTNNLAARIDQHRAAEDPKSFSAKYGVRRLLYFERWQNVREAIAREKEIKGWRREKKERLIETINPFWKFLDEENV